MIKQRTRKNQSKGMLNIYLKEITSWKIYQEKEHLAKFLDVGKSMIKKSMQSKQK